MDMLIVEADHYFKPFVAGREDELSASISALLNSPMPSMADYLASMDKHESVSRDVTTFFADHDLLLLPTSPVTAPPHDIARVGRVGTYGRRGPRGQHHGNVRDDGTPRHIHTVRDVV